MLEPISTIFLAHAASSAFWTGVGVGSAMGGLFGYKKVQDANTRAANAERELERLSNLNRSTRRIATIFQAPRQEKLVGSDNKITVAAEAKKRERFIAAPRPHNAEPQASAFLKRYS